MPKRCSPTSTPCPPPSTRRLPGSSCTPWASVSTPSPASRTSTSTPGSPAPKHAGWDAMMTLTKECRDTLLSKSSSRPNLPGLLQGREYNDHQHGGGKRRHYYMTHDGYNVYSSGGACLRHADLATALPNLTKSLTLPEPVTYTM